MAGNLTLWDNIILDLQDGLTLAKIAKLHDVCELTVQRECKRHGKTFSEFKEIYKPKKEKLITKTPPSSTLANPPTRNDPPAPPPVTGGERLTEADVEDYIKELIVRQREDPRVAQVAVQWLEKKNALTTSLEESSSFQIQKELLTHAKKEMFS